MDFRSPYPKKLPNPGDNGYAAAVEEYLDRQRSFYHARASWHRRFYRSSGILVILVGAALPLLTTLSYSYKDLVVSILGVSIAALTALRAFYRWDQSWVLLRATERAITGAWWDYHAKVSDLTADDPATRQQRNEAARELARLIVELQEQEAESFFKDMAFPSKDGG